MRAIMALRMLHKSCLRRSERSQRISTRKTADFFIFMSDFRILTVLVGVITMLASI
jgi:hypothetical protein